MAALEVLVSPPGTGKTSHCIELFKDRVLRSKGGIDSRSYFVLPSREHADRIQSLILRDTPGLFNAHILTIQDLADRVVAVPGRGRPTESVRRSAVAEALGTTEGESVYGYFRESVGLRGFQELALESIREFKAGLLSVRDFEARAQTLRRKDPVFALKYKDFSILLKRYDAKLEALGLSEADDDLAACERPEEGGSLELVIFDGFYHFTRAQKKLLTMVSAQAERTIVTLTLDSAHSAGEVLFGYPERTRKFLVAAGFKETGRLAENHRVKDPALRHLAANLFSPKPVVWTGSAPPLVVLAAPSKRIEFEMIAREIRRLYREENVHYSDVCVVMRAVSGRRALVESVFAEFGLPATVHERNRLLESGLAAALHRFLRLGEEDWSREDVLYLAKSSYFRRALSLEDALEIERAALKENLVSGRAKWDVLSSSEKLSASARAFLSGLLRSESSARGAATAHAFGAAVDAFLKSLTKPAGGASALDEAAAKSVASILASLRRRCGAGTEAFAGDAAAREALAAVENGLLSLKASGRNRVQVYDAVMALPKEYKIVFVADLLEKTFPQSVTEDPLFKDAERRALNGDDPVLDERAWRLTGERYFFYMAVTRAREKVYLTYSTHDADGKPALASFFLEEALRCFAPGAVWRLEKDVSRFLPEPDEWESAGDVARGAAALSARGGAARAFAAETFSRWKAPEALVRALKTPSPAGGAEFRDPKVFEAMKAFAGPFSASGIEKFIACPFRHFAEDLLRLNQPVEGREEAFMGTLLHDVLQEYFKDVLTPEDRASGAYLKDSALMEKNLKALLERGFEKSPLGSAPLYRRTIWLDSMKRMLEGYVRLELDLVGSGLVPTYFEYAFSGKDALRLADPSGEIALKGSVDRIDVDAEGRAVVIDYKRSSRNLKKKIEKGDEIQMPIYLLAASRLLKLKPAGMEHRVLRTGRREDSGLSPEDLAALLVRVEEKVRDAVRTIRKGRIAVDSKDCRFCEFGVVCRVEAKKNV